MTKTHLKLAGGAQGFNWLPVFVAIERGLFDRAGIEVELIKLGGVDKATQAVIDGEADLAITPPEGAISNYLAGGDLRVVASNANRLPMSLVARPEIQSIADLRGKKIGTSSLTEGTAIYTQIMLAEHGLAYPGDYEFAIAGIHTARWDAMQKGEIDAAPQPAPWNFLAADQGYSLLGEVNHSIPEIVFAAFIGKLGVLKEKSAALASFFGALDVAYDFVNDPANENACVPIFQGITTRDNAGTARQGYIYMRDMGMWPRHMAVPRTALETSIDLMVRANLIAADQRTSALGVYAPELLGRELV
jgi:ABC-type nitrate/sulfonate/bicarbonate transport system substrate-binding protein